MENWSFTKIDEFTSCPRKYKYKYIDKLFKMEKSVHLSIGTGVHAVLEHYAVNHDMTLERAQQIYMDAALSDSTGDLEKVKQSFEIVEAYFKSGKVLTPKRDPLKGTYMTEDFFKFPIDDEVNLTGKIDIITEKNNIVDYKTASQFFNENELTGVLHGKGLQLTICASAYKHKFKKLPNYVGFQVILTRPPKGYEQRVQNIGTKRTQEDLDSLVPFVLGIVEQEKRYREEDYFPKGSDPKCHWCPFDRMCDRE